MKILKSSLWRELIIIVLILVGIYLSSRAMFHEGFFRTIDDITTVRIEHMSRELKRGEWLSNFPVRYGAELSHRYGYFVYLFYAPLVYYAGAVSMIILGLSDIMATKLVYAIPLLLGPLIFYWAIRQKLGRLPSLVATMLYALFPFRGFDSYIRGGVGEAWAMMFFPGVIGGLFLFDKKNKWAPLTLTLFLTTGIISHNISGLLILSTVITYGIFFQLRNKFFWLSLLHSLAISAFFWLPSLAYSGIVKVSTSVDHNGLITNYLVPIENLLRFKGNSDISDKTSPFLVYILIFAGLVTTYIYKIKQQNDKQLLFWTLLGIVLYFSLVQNTKWLWTILLPISRNLQFPWRILIILSTVIPLCLGFALNAFKHKFTQLILALLVISMCIYFAISFKPIEYSYYYNYNAEETGPCATSWGEEYFPKLVNVCVTKPAPFSLKLPVDAQYKLLADSLLDTRITVASSLGGYIEAQRYYFPGWRISIDEVDQDLDYQYSQNGLFRTTMKPGQHEVRLYWTKTLMMWIADIVSLMGLLAFVGAFIREVRRR